MMGGSLWFIDQPVLSTCKFQNNETLSHRRWTVFPKLTLGVLGIHTHMRTTCTHSYLHTYSYTDKHTHTHILKGKKRYKPSFIYVTKPAEE